MNVRTLKELIFTAMGEASMCWDPPPTGVFDSSRAKEIGDRLIEAIAVASQKPEVKHCRHRDTSMLGVRREETGAAPVDSLVFDCIGYMCRRCGAVQGSGGEGDSWETGETAALITKLAKFHGVPAEKVEVI